MSAISRREEWCKKVLSTVIDYGEPIRKMDICVLVCDEENGAYISGLIDGLVMSGMLKAFKLNDQRETWIMPTFRGMRLYATLI